MRTPLRLALQLVLALGLAWSSHAGALGDFVWEDLNFDGCQGPGEPGIANATVQLLDCNSNLLATTLTGPQGQYLFANLSQGSYIVRFIAPQGYHFTTQMNCGNISVDSDPNPLTGLTTCVFLNAGETNRTVDAGLFREACLGDFIWDDFNHNGIQDGGEPGISNVTVYLTSCGSTNILQTTVTSPSGLYQFCNLLPGDYKITIVVPNGYRRTIENATNDCFDSDGLLTTNTPNPTNGSALLSVIVSECATLISGETNLCLDVGMHRTGAIGGFVWQDLNSNGIQDPGEPGLPSIQVQLQSCLGNVLTNTTTTVNGFYLFAGLPPGGYRVRFSLASAYLFTSQNVGNDAFDSDADPMTGLTACYMLGSGQTLTVDAGLICSSVVVLSTNSYSALESDGVRVYYQASVSGIPPLIYAWTFYDSSSNTLFSVTTTNSNSNTVSRLFGPFDEFPSSFALTVRNDCGFFVSPGGGGTTAPCGPICLSIGVPSIFAGTNGSGTNYSFSSACGTFGPGSRWFRITTTNVPGIYTIGTEGSTYNTTFGVCRGLPSTRTNLALVACTTNAPGQKNRLQFETQPDTNYWLVVNPPPTAATLKLTYGYELKIANLLFNSTNRSVDLRTAPLPSLRYKLLASTNLDTPAANWSNLLTTNFSASVSASNNVLRFVDTNLPNFSRRFYEIQVAP